jgi:hypothetical protein
MLRIQEQFCLIENKAWRYIWKRSREETILKEKKGVREREEGWKEEALLSEKIALLAVEVKRIYERLGNLCKKR